MSTRITGAVVHFEHDDESFVVLLDGPALEIARIELDRAYNHQSGEAQLACAVALHPTLNRIRRVIREAANALESIETPAGDATGGPVR